jgi:hypothetical protein
MQLFVCGCVSYPWSAMLYHLWHKQCNGMLKYSLPEKSQWAAVTLADNFVALWIWS